MNKASSEIKMRLAKLQSAIEKMRKDATPTTSANVEMAIEMLALPEIAKLEAQLEESKSKHER